MKDHTEMDFKDGKGAALFRSILTQEEMGNAARAFCITTLPTGSSIGMHSHRGDSETFYILSGTALYNDNGNEITLGPGDSAHCPDGSSHAIRNAGTMPLRFIALILYTR